MQVGFDFKSGRLPQTPKWSEFAGEGVTPPEGGFAPPPPEQKSAQNPAADGSVGQAASLMRQYEVRRVVFCPLDLA